MVNIVTVEINNKTFKTVISAGIDTNLDDFGFDFDLEINIPIEESEFRTLGEAIKINIDGKTMLTGFIEATDLTYFSDTANLKVSGRDKLCDFVDSRVSNKIFKTPIGFVEILTDLLKETGYQVVSPNRLIGLQKKLGDNQVAIINEYGSIDKFETNESISFGKDEKAFSLIQRLADKRQLVIGTNGDGNIVIRKIGQERCRTILQNNNLFNSPNSSNNIKNASMKRDESKMFYEYKIFSSGKTSEPDSDKTGLGAIKDALSKNTTQRSGVFYDNNIRKTRRFLDNISSLSSKQCTERAEWEANIRRSKSFEYNCSVFGFRQNLSETKDFSFGGNQLWKINQLVYVSDKQAGIEDELLIKSVKYRKSLSGTICDMKLVDPLSYTKSVFKPLIKKSKRSLAIDFSPINEL
ncbi:MAG: prophage tail gpP-like protein [Flavobacteriales bacterium]|jgi:prophage tail gpP-like protein